MLVLTYRDDELSREHALGGLLGQASRSDRVRRLPLRRLSAGAVQQLSAGTAVNGADLYELTAGNAAGGRPGRRHRLRPRGILGERGWGPAAEGAFWARGDGARR